MPLDRSKPFGEVFGTTDHKYLQDGKKFDHEGKDLGPAPKGAGKAPGKPSPEPDQVGSQLKE